MSLLDYSAIQEGLTAHTERHSWTHLRTVYSGDGQTPPTVAVPIARRQHEGEVYWYDESVESRAVGVAIDSSGVLGAGNEFAGLRIQVGYPPGVTDLLHVYPGMSKEGLKQTGGVTPIVRTLIERSVVTPFQFAELRLDPGTGLVPIVSAGKWRSGETSVIWSQGNGPNLTSYVPAISGKAVWVLVSQNNAGAFAVDAGSEINAAAAFSSSQLPNVFRDGELQIGWVKLVNGVTDLANATIIQAANIPAIFSSAAGLSLQPTIIAQDYTIPVNYQAVWVEGYTITTGSLTVIGDEYILNEPPP